jgi:hypothetical protein
MALNGEWLGVPLCTLTILPYTFELHLRWLYDCVLQLNIQENC